jgi:hypothetical protein
MDCAAVKPRMEALVNGSLPESERTLAEQHITVCEGCRLELELVRAIGSQEKAPAVGKDDWTLDRIFGAEKASTSTPVPSAAKPGPWGSAKDAEPASSSDAAADALFGPATPASTTPPPTLESASAGSVAEPPRKWGKKAESAPAEGASWDFEPADAKSNVKPPEQSLFFATEALTRRRDLDSRKGSGLRVILWGAGGLVGAGLLAFSAWFVLHKGAQPPAVVAPNQQVPEAPPAGPGTTQPPAQGAPSQETAPPPDNSAQIAPPPPPPRIAAGAAGPQTMPLGTRATEPPATTRTPGATAPKPKALPSSPRPSEPTEHRAAPSTVAPRTTSRSSDQGSAPPPPEETSRPTPPATKTPTEDPTAEEPAVDSGAEAPKATHPGATTPTTPTTTTRGSSMWQTQTPKPVEAESEAPAVEATSPIERLHLATAAAEEHGDLVGLRRLRATWKTFMVKIVGPDRARAKREYADCLWAIQDLTGRHADQKDALAAYREYLLGAPAGGADSRSVSRLRQLEDAISESR